MKNRSLIRNLGYSLIATALVVFLLLTFTPEFLPSMAGFAYLLLGVGILLLLAGKSAQIIQQERLLRSRIRCESCAWDGRGEKVFRTGVCPECDSERLAVIEKS